MAVPNFNFPFPGGEINCVPAGEWKDKNGITRPSAAKVWISPAGKESACYQANFLKRLYEAIKESPEVKDFLGIKDY